MEKSARFAVDTPTPFEYIEVMTHQHLKEKSAVPLTRALTFLGRDRNWFNHYFSKLSCLSTKFREPVGGRARMLSRKNVLELAFLNAAVNRGMPVGPATMLVKRWLSQDEAGTMAAWWFIPGGYEAHPLSERASIVGDGDLTFNAVAKALAPPINTIGVEEIDAPLPAMAEVLVAINLGEIRRRVDALMALELSEESEEEDAD